MIDATTLDIFEKQYHEKWNTYKRNEAYVRGKNPTIYEQQGKRKPDNRIPVPLAKAAVEDMTGYAASVGNINVQYLSQNVEETEAQKALRDEYINIRKKIYNHNKTDINTSELYTQVLTQGEAYELFWVSDELNLPYGIMTPEYTMVDNREIVVVWDSSLKPKMIAAIRFHRNGNRRYADVYYPLYMEAYYKDVSDKDTYDFGGVKKKTGKWIRDKERDTVYPYTNVPIALYKGNKQCIPLFEAEKEMIDAHDNLISKSVNEVDRFNALIALFPDKITPDFMAKFEEYKAIDDLAEYDHWPQYLEKSLDKISAFYKDLADRLKTYIHTTMKVPDFSDKNFAGNASGIAIRFKLMGMEFKAAQIDAYFNEGIEQRNDLINQVMNAGTKKWENYKLSINNKRNIPIDEVEKAEIAMKLLGVVSTQTLLNYLPNSIVDDVELELELLKKDVYEGLNLDE